MEEILKRVVDEEKMWKEILELKEEKKMTNVEFNLICAEKNINEYDSLDVPPGTTAIEFKAIVKDLIEEGEKGVTASVSLFSQYTKNTIRYAIYGNQRMEFYKNQYITIEVSLSKDLSSLPTPLKN